MKRRADGRWQKKKRINGEQIFFYSDAKTEKQAIKDIENQMIEYAAQIYEKKHNFKFLADKAIEQKGATTGYKNIESYTTAMKHVQSFYSIDIENIRPIMVQKILDDMANKEYSFSSIHKVKTLLSVVFDYAIVHEDIPIQNFLSSIKIPKKAKKGTVTSPPEFVRDKIFEYGTSVDFGLWPIMLICTGLRRGEQDAIKKSDIDFVSDEIHLNRSVEFIHNQPHIKDTLKTDESKTTVPILQKLKPYLEEACKNLTPDDFLFGGEKPLTETQIKKRWKKYCEQIGYTFKGHQLRHAYALLLYEAGVDVKTAQRLLRHADIRTTMNIYTDFSKKMTDKSIKKIDEYLNSQKVVKTSVNSVFIAHLTDS